MRIVQNSVTYDDTVQKLWCQQYKTLVRAAQNYGAYSTNVSCVQHKTLLRTEQNSGEYGTKP